MRPGSMVVLADAFEEGLEAALPIELGGVHNCLPSAAVWMLALTEIDGLGVSVSAFDSVTITSKHGSVREHAP